MVFDLEAAKDRLRGWIAAGKTAQNKCGYDAAGQDPIEQDIALVLAVLDRMEEQEDCPVCGIAEGDCECPEEDLVGILWPSTTPPASTSTAIAAGEPVAWQWERRGRFGPTIGKWESVITPYAPDTWPEDDRRNIVPLYAATPKAASEDGATGLVNAWREAVIDGLIVAHIYNEAHDTDPRKALHDLICWEVDVALDPAVSERAAALASPTDATGAFKRGDRVTKISGSSWTGTVVGTYSTSLTPEGYAVESDTEIGSVQIYPAKALRLLPVAGEPL